jgi:hypothetical protein
MGSSGWPTRGFRRRLTAVLTIGVGVMNNGTIDRYLILQRVSWTTLNEGVSPTIML